MARKKFMKNLLTATGLAGGLALLHLDSKYRIEQENIELYFENLPESFNGFTIAQISDLHGTMFGEDNFWLLSEVRRAKPSIIAMTGDFIDKKSDLPDFEKIVKDLVDIAPVYFVAGNHDWRSGYIVEITSILKKYGATYLSNSYVELRSKDESIMICGAEEPSGTLIRPDEFIADMRTQHPDSFTVLLAHRNYWMERYPAIDVDTILCGHGHGGIIRLPGIGGVFGTNMNFFPDNADVLYYGKRYQLVISRGLGNAVSIPRMFNNAHLPLVKLLKS